MLAATWINAADGLAAGGVAARALLVRRKTTARSLAAGPRRTRAGEPGVLNASDVPSDGTAVRIDRTHRAAAGGGVTRRVGVRAVARAARSGAAVSGAAFVGEVDAGAIPRVDAAGWIKRAHKGAAAQVVASSWRVHDQATQRARALRVQGRSQRDACAGDQEVQ